MGDHEPLELLQRLVVVDFLRIVYYYKTHK